MGSYFPIPNDLRIESKENLIIKSSITVFNYPNNSLLKNINKRREDIFYCIYFLKNKKWHKYDQIRCGYGEYLEIKRDDLKIPNNSIAIAIPRRNSSNPNITSKLITPFSLRKDNSPIEERASYNFYFKNICTSYQGEFPYKLSKNKRASFFSFDSLRLDQNINTRCYLILINLNQESNNRSKNIVKLYNPTTKKVFKEISIKTNSIKYFRLPKLKKDTLYKNPTFISCNSNTFIPIFLTINLDKKNYELSVEHTHPPSELFWGIDRYKFIEKLKSNWIL
tara:strand:- start:406 stop:1245 length:840 start_codon:yes stop_codon:yes gene_type:complete